MCRFVVLVATVLAVTSGASVLNLKSDTRLPHDERIIGGSVTDASKYPHQVSLQYKSCDTCPFEHICGGSIINATVILTAAHCITNAQENRLHVSAGTNIRNGHGVVVPVERIVYHEDYSKNLVLENDIAILFLAAELPVDRFNIKPIELITELPPNGLKATVAGWGATTEDGEFSDKLLEIDVPIVSNDICAERYGEGLINDSMLCAGSTTGQKDACGGDSGGALVVNGALAGIVSWGFGCARPEYPGVYANIMNLRPWIDEKLR